MINRKNFFIIAISLLLLCACNTNTAANKLDTGNKVENIINEQIKNADSQASDPVLNIVEQNRLNNMDQKQDLGGTDFSDGDIDYDLSKMNSDMIYASIYQLMMEPNEYIGKKFRMVGTYYATYYEPNNKYYNYVVIEDAAACCAQGIEFVLADTSKKYPDDFPKENVRVEITGTFETYKDEGDDRLFSRLYDCEMRIVE